LNIIKNHNSSEKMESYLIKNSLLSAFMVAEVHAIWSRNVTTTIAEKPANEMTKNVQEWEDERHFNSFTLLLSRAGIMKMEAEIFFFHPVWN